MQFWSHLLLLLALALTQALGPNCLADSTSDNSDACLVGPASLLAPAILPTGPAIEFCGKQVDAPCRLIGFCDWAHVALSVRKVCWACAQSSPPSGILSLLSKRVKLQL